MSNTDETIVTAEKDPDAGLAAAKDEAFFKLTKSNAIILTLALVIVMMIAVNIGSNYQNQPVKATVASVAPTQNSTVTASSTPEPALPVPIKDSVAKIERNGEGRLFYTTIKIPANAETLYLSGSGAAKKDDGTWGSMEEQAINTFTKFKDTLESEGWSMSDIVQVRAFAVAGDYGLLDFDGFNRGYSQFFGTAENPGKPVRSFVQVADLVVDGWLVEIEIRAARVPADS